MPVPFMKHGRRHASGGEDPIPGLGSLKWCVATMYQVSVSKSGSYYPIRFDGIGTNDTTIFTLAGSSGSPARADWVQINSAGVYLAKFSLVDSVASGWTTKYAEIDPTYASGGTTATSLDSALNGDTDWDQSYTIMAEHNTTDTDHRSLARDFTFLWDGGSNTGAGDLNYENPLKIGLRLNSTQTTNLSLVGQVFLLQLASSASYTATAA